MAEPANLSGRDLSISDLLFTGTAQVRHEQAGQFPRLDFDLARLAFVVPRGSVEPATTPLTESNSVFAVAFLSTVLVDPDPSTLFTRRGARWGRTFNR